MHLDDSQLVDLALHRGNGESAAHVAECPTCSEELARWRHVMTDLQTIEYLALDDREMHRLRTLFEAYGPARSQFREWAAHLVRSSSAPATAGIRGQSGHELREYAAGPHVILLQLADEGRNGWTVHGQVLTSGARELGDGDLVITDCDGRGATVKVDGNGEFHCAGLPSGRYAATWWLGPTRIDEPNLILGGDG